MTGETFPRCQNCAHFVRRDDRHSCKLHDFVMPSIGMDVFCADHNPRGVSAPALALFESIQPNFSEGALYYYVGEVSIGFVQLGTFAELQSQIISAWLRNDDTRIVDEKRLGWFILVESKYLQFLSALSDCRLSACGNTLSCQIIDAAEIAWREAERKKMAWISIVGNKVLSAPGCSESIQQWLSSTFDLSLIEVDQNVGGDVARRAGIPVFLEINSSLVRLLPDIYTMQNLFGAWVLRESVSGHATSVMELADQKVKMDRSK